MVQDDGDGGGGRGAPTVQGDHGGADGEGLIDPDAFPIRSWQVDLDGVMDAAAALTTIGTRVQERSENLTTTWAPLRRPGVYEAPEDDRVHALMDPAVDAGASVAASSSEAASALYGFWGMLVFLNVKGRLENLEEEAQTFRDDALAGVPRVHRAGPLGRLLDLGKSDTVPWYENPEWVHDNDDLLQRYAEILEDISVAAVNAAEQIEKIDGMPDLPDVEPYDADAIVQTPMPWGSSRDPKLPWEQQIVIGVAKTVWGTVKGLAALAGWDGSSLWPSPSVAGNAWAGMGNSILGLAVLGVRNKMPGGPVDDDDIDDLINSDDPLLRYLGRRLRDGQDLVLPLAGGGTSVDIEEAARRWEKEPWEIGSETATAWLLMFLPGPKTKGVPMSPRAAAMFDDMLRASELVQTGSGWYTKGGLRVADAAGRWLGDRIYGGSGGSPGGTHMWTPGDPHPTPGDKPGGAHKPGKHK